MSMTRRSFLAAAGLAAAPMIIPRSAFGANERIQVGFIGVGRRAQDLVREVGKLADMEGVAAADLNPARLAKFKDKGWKVYAEYRELLADPSIDAVVVATPDHWHALPSIDACNAGKDVYVEKPMTLTIREGRLMVEAARKNKRIVQVGSQQRSTMPNILSCKFIREGKLGAIKEVHSSNYPSPWECDLPEEPVPDGLNWDAWCGQTTPRPYHKDLYLPRAEGRLDAKGRPLGWISYRPYSGGEMTGWGAHGLDQIQWALGMDNSGPVEVWADMDAPESERFGFSIAKEGAWANAGAITAPVHMRYANGVMLHIDGRGNAGGGRFVGERGEISTARGEFKTNPPELALEITGGRENKPDSSENHMANWRDCIRSRELSAADVEIGHRSCTVCHLGNIARWIGKPLKWDPVAEKFDSEEANALVSREGRKPYQFPA